MEKIFNKKHIAKISLFLVFIFFFIFLAIFTQAQSDVISSKDDISQADPKIMFKMK